MSNAKIHAFLGKKVPKTTSVTNWRLNCAKKTPNILEVEWWQAGSSGTSIGKGIVSGARSSVASAFSKKTINVAKIHYVESIDSWLVEDTNGKYLRLGWANAYQSEKYPCYKSRSEVDAIINKCTGSIKLLTKDEN